jgi:phosphotransferase system enzyme I (PtsI)
MVETLSFIGDLDASDAEFFSIGTNDLIANTLQYDRYAESDEAAHDPTHPLVLDAIVKTIDAAKQKNITACVCGDMAANPAYFALLVGAGIHKMSVGPSKIPLIKELGRRIDTEKAKSLFTAVINEDDRGKRLELIERFNAAELNYGAQGISLRLSSKAANDQTAPSTTPIKKLKM